MKKLYLILFLIISANKLLCDNYAPVNTIGANYFLCSDNQIRAVKIVSINNHGNYLFQYLNSTWNTDSSACIKPNGYSILGDYIVKSTMNSAYYFFNKNMDTIIIKSTLPVNSNWTMYHFKDGSYYQAFITKMSKDNILDFSDYVKHFVIARYDPSGNLMDDPFNNFEFSISSDHGIVNFFNVLSFPETVEAYSLTGTTNPPAGSNALTFRDIYDKETGSEFHYTYKYVYPQQLLIDAKCIYKILDKEYSLDSPTVYYTTQVKKLIHQVTYNPYTQTDTLISYTVQDSFDISTGLSEYLPEEPIINKESDNNYKGTHFGIELLPGNKRRILSQPATSFRSQSGDSDSCWVQEPQDGVYYGKYLEGCGLFSSHFVPFGDILNDDWDLVYYKIGNDIWGTPLELTSVDTEPAENSFGISPNPISDVARITGIEAVRGDRLEIINFSGETILILPFSEKVDLSGLSAGFYFIKYGNRVGKFIKV